jgi:hypothetical protein
MARITFGYPDPRYVEQMEKEESEGKIRHWGCCTTDDDPSWQCVTCKTIIYKRKYNKK